MRALFEDVPSNSTEAANSGIVIDQVGVPALAANKRDLWFYFTRSDASTILVRACKVREIAPAGAYIASALITAGASRQTVVLSRNGTKTPDMTGLQIVGTFSAVPDVGAYYWWAYTSSPDLVVCDNIVTRLCEYTGAGQSLDAVDAVDIFVGDDTEARSLPAINVISQPAGVLLSSDTGSCMSLAFPIEVHIGVASLDTPAGAWRTSRSLMAAVESILHDECRRSYGETRLYRTGAQGPGPAASQPTVMVGVVSLNAEFHHVWRDDIYPRS